MSFATDLLKANRHYAARMVLAVVLLAGAVPVAAQADGPEDACNATHISDWHLKLLETHALGDPEATLIVVEDFLQQCPYHPDALRAQAIAGMAAVDLGQADEAATYFSHAGTLATPRQRFSESAVYLSLGEEAHGWQLRDDMIADWQAAIERDPNIHLSVSENTGGRIFALEVLNRQRLDGLVAAWIAVPTGAGWPASVLVRWPTMTVPFATLQPIDLAGLPLNVDLYRCHARFGLPSPGEMSHLDEMRRAIGPAFQAYLEQPDRYTELEGGPAISTCDWPDELLPRPER